MSQAIRDVSDTLLELLRAEVTLVAPETIALVTPAEAAQVGGVRLALSLYSITPAAEFRNELEVVGDPDQAQRRAQPVDLYYLLTAFPPEGDNATERTLNTQHVLGFAMRVLFEHGTLTGSVLRGELPRDEELRLTFQPITVEDLTRIWGVFPDNALQTSVSYVVSPVRLWSTAPLAGPRTVSRQTEVDQLVPVHEEE